MRASLTDDCERILRRSHWPSRVRAAFATYEPHTSADPARGREAYVAWLVAPAVGVDLWQEGLRHFERHPQDHVLAFWLIETPERARAERVIQVAEMLLPSRIQVDTPLGPRPPGVRISVLTYLFQGMRQHAILSSPLVTLALKLGGRDRFSAVSILEQHDPMGRLAEQLFLTGYLRRFLAEQPVQPGRGEGASTP